MKELGKFTATIILIICSFLTGLLSTYIILSIATLYQLTFITQYSFIQIYGVLLLIGMIRLKIDKKKKELEDRAVELITSVILLLLCWGFAYIAYHIIA